MAQQGPNPIELYEAAVQAFRQTLSGVKADQMQGSTPCTEWNVQALIKHNIQVAAFVEGLLQENITVNPLEVSGAIPGDDPLKALDDNVAKLMDIIKASGSADTQINTPFGEMTRGQFMMTPTWDLVVHKWDLAKGTGQNTALDNTLVEAVYNTFAPWQMECGRWRWPVNTSLVQKSRYRSAPAYRTGCLERSGDSHNVALVSLD